MFLAVTTTVEGLSSLVSSRNLLALIVRGSFFVLPTAVERNQLLGAITAVLKCVTFSPNLASDAEINPVRVSKPPLAVFLDRDLGGSGILTGSQEYNESLAGGG